MEKKLTVEIAEGLGNQLFMYSHAYALAKKINYYSLCSYNFLIEYAAKQNYISNEEIDELKKWRSDPENWNK